ncbi:ATP-dependent DNA helicase RecG [Siccirubricoccus deserti]|uniref:ATP-dependent DNA helicase RecG n=1 Tax=Siccirubricoccus deserti TaxID=2013562 RepID=A0A9X0UFU2_9PROT|nr:ATP-dependent DNA helicase RecG [Siccirubricoccus deserti]MBC4014710.1 ATP-dependent DNA helicase RecG [Siccirubricoccus deserti]GGC34397.1 ATP-dependent DNA helicase RecG [Siccirubricoccus deserti]
MPRETPALEATEDQGLAPLLAPLASLPGIGPVISKRLVEAAGGDRVRDLLFHLPERYATRIRVASPAEAPPDAEVILPALVGPMRTARSRTGRPYVEVRAEAAGKRLLIRYINGRAEWLRQLLPEATERLFAGRVKPEGNIYSMLNPLSASTPEGLPELEPVWPLVKGLSLRHVARAMREALALLTEPPEWHDPALLRREGWPGFAAALRQVQAPEALPPPTARTRLAYDEALAGQVALALVRRRVRLRPGRALKGDGTLRVKALAAFGHPPTPSQTHALAEIDADLAAPHRMLRLLQGDVGSGKTLVAVLAMLRAVEAGAQAAIMAPTEILARQHLRTLVRLCMPAGVRVELLAGSVKGAQRKRVLAGLAEGSVKIVVGTHALFQEGVAFRDLGLAVVDEQHRFGVAQRLMLAEKGDAADMLVMTATPIPRTLLLTQWGEMAVSRLHGKPAGRQPITTTLHGLRQLDQVVAGLARALDRGARVYWVCPHVAESEVLDLAAAETRFAELSARFPGQVGLAHGKLDPELREQALRDFAAGRTKLLVATTVIEVGVDVPEATVMVVEHADRFGLAQLHQLRGRVGRGAAASYCMLLYDEGLGLGSRERLMILRDTEDGFAIADADFRLRGGGEALGTRQSGAPVFRLGLTEGEAQEGLILMANRDATLLLEKDPLLAGPRGVAVRQLLRIFDKDAAMASLRAG